MTDAMHLVLIVEDDPAMQEILRMLFETHGFRVILAETARDGEHYARLHRPDAVIVDLGLPDRDGLTVISGIRLWSAVPIIALSARSAEPQRLMAFDVGCDDYVVKPFSTPEFIARVRAINRRHVRGELPNGILKLGKVSVDLGMRIATHCLNGEIRLTPTEHRILEMLVRNGERIVRHADIIKEVWGPSRGDARALRVHIRSLRAKLEVDPCRPCHILTELGVGYRLVATSESNPNA